MVTSDPTVITEKQKAEINKRILEATRDDKGHTMELSNYSS
jgi:hypothetical protein